MQIVISPAKTLDFDSKPTTNIYTDSIFLDQSSLLIDRLAKYSVARIAKLMSLSKNLATLNAERYKSWQLPFNPDNAKQAILAFKGDVYLGLVAETMSQADLDFAQQNLRILSGLYGVLKPLDLIQPYRLEMGTSLKYQRANNLYQFWGDKITNSLNEEGQDTLINLASNEYFKAIKPKKLNANIITPIFKDCKAGNYKVISFFAKKARGMMARYIIDNRLTQPENIKSFQVAGYYFNAEQSTANEWVFLREEQ
ncbi:MAG: peroxide stress protein YaaA [Rhizobiales bacterium]|nr:peroxide stress protein YaaA [Hyphomicrobiales bacterium]NRB13671.1 peroxide stress protein YaaA [Hyphomicrobiales bacterium]